MTTNECRGSCLCGSVRLVIPVTTLRMGACHCRICRRWGGGPLFAVETSRAIRIEGEEHITVYPSSDWAERGFCRRCGSHLFYRLKAGGQYEIPVGLLDDDQPWVFEHQIFIDAKPAYYDFANPTRNLTGDDLFTAYSGAPDR